MHHTLTTPLRVATVLLASLSLSAAVMAQPVATSQQNGEPEVGAGDQGGSAGQGGQGQRRKGGSGGQGQEKAQDQRKGPGGEGGQGGGSNTGAMIKAAIPQHDLDIIVARPTLSSVTLSIMASASADVTLQWGEDPIMASSRLITLEAGVPYEAEIEGLATDTAYQYQVLKGEEAMMTGAFHTARPAGESFTFAIQADSHLDSQSDLGVYENTLANIVADKPDMLIDLGDTFMNDKFANYEDAADQYLAQRYYLGLSGRFMAVYLTLGNHDGEAGWSTKSSEAMADWSRERRMHYFPAPQADAGAADSFYSGVTTLNNYYSWQWGDALFVVLDPFTATETRPSQNKDGWAWTLGKAQYDWLQETLAGSDSAYKFVFIHHLIGGLPGVQATEARGGAEASDFYEWGGNGPDGSAGFAEHRPGWSMPVHELLKTYQVSAVFHGHDHLYVHQERDGIVYQEVPQPSHSREDATNSAAEYGYESGTLLGSSGHVRVSVSPDEAVVEYVKSRLAGENAEVVDRYSIEPTSK